MRVRLKEVERHKVADWANQTLRTDAGKEAIDYLRSNKRHFDDKAIKLALDVFNLGYVPSYVYNEEGDRHELADKIVLPIYDQYNDLVALSSRGFKENDPRKFWHEKFAKSYYLYGLNIAKPAIIQRNKAIMVEGEFDAIYLHSKGFDCAVGILGSAPQLYQIAMLSRYCQEVFVVFDGDEGGREATERAIRLMEDHNLRIYDLAIIPVYLPFDKQKKEKTDPDDFIEKFGAKEFAALLRESRENNVLNIR